MKATGLAAVLGTATGTGSATRKEVPPSRIYSEGKGAARVGGFKVTLDGEGISGVHQVDIPSISFEQDRQREGNKAPHERKVAGNPTYDDLEMERGVKIGDTMVWDWVNTIRHGKVDGSRREIAVAVMDTEGNAQTRWEFTVCWPTNYDPPDLDASADGDVRTESLTVAFDKMIRAE